MDSAFKRFLKGEAARSGETSTGMNLLDRAFKIPKQSFLLLKGQSSAGTTAVALQLASQLGQTGKQVFYFDMFESLVPHKLYELDYLCVVKPWDKTPSEIYDIIEKITEEFPDAYLIFENIHLLNSQWRDWTFTEFMIKVMEQFPELTIIGTQRNNYSLRDWSVVVDISKLTNIYIDFEDGENHLLGHLAKIVGPYGESTIFIDYSIGRISQAYELAIQEIESGLKTKTSLFEYEDIKEKGYWNFVYKMGLKKRNGT